MPLENQGSSGSSGSHWETTVINGEIMNAAISSTQGAFSKFTTSLLRDTGFYDSISTTLEEPITFGKNAGCSFTTDSCDPNINQEFCVGGTRSICDSNGYSISVCKPT